MIDLNDTGGAAPGAAAAQAENIVSDAAAALGASEQVAKPKGAPFDGFGEKEWQAFGEEAATIFYEGWYLASGWKGWRLSEAEAKDSAPAFGRFCKVFVSEIIKSDKAMAVIGLAFCVAATARGKADDFQAWRASRKTSGTEQVAKSAVPL